MYADTALGSTYYQDIYGVKSRTYTVATLTDLYPDPMYDNINITSLSSALSIHAPSSQYPIVHGQTLYMQITSDSSSHALTWDSSFSAVSALPLPTTSTA